MPDAHYDPRNVARPTQNAWGTYTRLLGYAWRYKGRLAVSLLFALVVAASFSSMILGVAGVVNVIFGEEAVVNEQVAGYMNRIADLPDAVVGVLPWDREELRAAAPDLVASMRADKMRALYIVSALVIVLTVLAGIARFLQEYFAGSIGASISVQLGEDMYRNVMRLSMRFFEQHSTGEILARFTNDIFMVNRGLAGVFVKLMREPIKALFFLWIALSVDPLLTAVGLGVLPLVALVIIRVGRKFKKSVRRSLEKIASMATVANETFSGIMIVKGFCMEGYEISRTSAEMQKLRRYLTKMVQADALVGPLVEIVMVLGVVAFIVFSGYRVIAGTLSSGELVALFSALAFMLDPVRKLASVNNLIQTSVASAERVFEFIDAEPDIVEAANPVALAPLEEALAFENVRFSYDGVTDVLNGIDLRIRKGEMIAVVGFSGAGKSTLVKLIPRFYDVTGGRIAIDGTDIRAASFESLRDQISIVTQDTILFNESVRKNITFGRDQYSEQRVRDAARAANAERFIDALPHGFETVIGESGGTLSGGQRQRLAIARAIIKDPSILILDEATSSLDSESERAIQEALDEFVVGRTTIVIAHRLSTVQRADRIVVLDEGRIAEEGTHAELMQRSGIYRRLYEVQFATVPAGQS
jgi:subfamily B ATP-binding cassette protein MsbA